MAGEENALGRFLKEHGKSDKTKAGKMMIGWFLFDLDDFLMWFDLAAGKTMSYCGQQRLAIRVPLVRLYQVNDSSWDCIFFHKKIDKQSGIEFF